MSGQNEVLPKNLEVDVWSRDLMYGLKYHSGRTALSPDVQFCNTLIKTTLFII
jgi:hypothetical protein